MNVLDFSVVAGAFLSLTQQLYPSPPPPYPPNYNKWKKKFLS